MTRMPKFRYMIYNEIAIEKEWSWYEHRYYLHTEAWKRNSIIRAYAYNERLNKWDLLGYQKPNGIFVDVWYTYHVIRKECEGYEFGCDKLGISDFCMDEYANAYRNDVINKTGNKVEFNNGIVFAKDSINNKWMMIRGAYEDYPILPQIYQEQ